MSDKNLISLQNMSNKYGANAEFVLAGGGNTSYKDDTTLYIKGSGTSLATIKADEFVRMDRSRLALIWDKKYSDDEATREAEVLSDMMDSRMPGESKRPSVETLLHNLFPYKFILHLHPALVNGITCSKNGASVVAKLFPDAVWVDNSKPGYTLAALCRESLGAYEKKNGKFPTILFLQNHGIFFAGNTTDELDTTVDGVMSAIKSCVKAEPDFSEVEFNFDLAVDTAPVIRMLYGNGEPVTVRFCTNRALLDYDPTTESFTPDHIVYCKASPLVVAEGDDICEKFSEYEKKNSYKPKIIYYRGLGIFSCGASFKDACTAETVFLDAVKISVYAQSFGGCSCMPSWLVDFIVNWEVESYRAKVSSSGASAKRLDKKIAVVTGGAQGFGRGIAEELAGEGAYVGIADMNYDGAVALSETLPNSTGIMVNVTDEESVKKMIGNTVLKYGGLDLFVNNAGIAKAGSLDEMQKSTFEFVTAVNYTGYFLCAKYASAIMKKQHEICPDYMMDIVEINSKSGLAGSNKNFAYAGSKFGGIGLTQSFAMELAPFNIKVNAVCPGNYLDGPLWSDPERGLFVQYLNAGKVPGAKNVADVRRFYESKVPLGRGCFPVDIARAIFYIVEQKYETGQAVPVTGGQEMLK